MKIALIVLLGLVGLVIAGALVAGPQLQGGLASFGPKSEGAKVRTQLIQMGKLTETVKAPGQIEPHTKVDISAEVAARIEDLPFREGDVVKKNDVVVRLDDRQLKAALNAAHSRRDGEAYRLQSEQAHLVGLESSISYRKKQLQRNQELFDSGDLPRKDLDLVLENVEDLQAQIESTKYSISVIESSLQAAQADIDRAEEDLSKTVMRAPMDGLITALNAEIGEVVLMGTMNNPGTVILTVADLSRMLLKAEVSESDISRIAIGQPAKVHINAYRDQVYSGTVTTVALQRTEKKTDGTGFFKAEVEIDLRGGRIRSGCLANVDIEIAGHDGLIIESQAVVDRLVEELPDEVKRNNPLVDPAKKTTTVVYRVVNGKTVCTPVKRGPSDDTHSVVLGGLNAGDVVVVGPFKMLEKLKQDELVTDDTAKPSATEPAAIAENKGGAQT